MSMNSLPKDLESKMSKARNVEQNMSFAQRNVSKNMVAFYLLGNLIQPNIA